jgi:hypothetical protein
MHAGAGKAAAAAGLPEWPLVQLTATRQDVLSEELARPNYRGVRSAMGS